MLGLTYLSVNAASGFQSGPGQAGQCAECHKITKEEAGKLLFAEKFKVTVKDVRESAVKGIWEVAFSREGQEGIGVVYIDFGKKFFIEGAQITPLENLEKASAPPVQKPLGSEKVDVKKIPLDMAVVFGDKKAAHKIIIFDDPDCPFCRQLHADVKSILARRSDVAFYVKMFPLTSIHPAAYAKSKAIVCKKSAKLLEDAFAGKDIPKAECKTDELENNKRLMEEFGINGTPAIILPDGRLIRGAVPAEVLLNLLDNPATGKDVAK